MRDQPDTFFTSTLQSLPMNLQSTSAPITQIEADAVVIGVFDDKQLGRAAEAVNAATGGQIARLIETKEFSGKRFELLPLLAPAGMKARQVLVVGLGEKSKFDAGMAYRATAAAAKCIASKPRPTVAYYLEAANAPRSLKARCAGEWLAARDKIFIGLRRNAILPKQFFGVAPMIRRSHVRRLLQTA